MKLEVRSRKLIMDLIYNKFGMENMKKWVLLSISILLLSFFGVSRSEGNNLKHIERGEKSQYPQPIFEGLGYGHARIKSVAVVANELAVLYVNNNKLRFRTSERKIILDEGGGYTSKNIWLVSKGQYVYAFWWVKFTFSNEKGEKNKIVQGKSLFVRSSNNYGKDFSPKVKINSDAGILPDIAFEADKLGHISVIYIDERSPHFQIYVNSSKDGGKNWLSSDMRLDKALGQEVKQVASYALTPRIVKLNNSIIAIWQQYDENNGKPVTRIIARESLDYGFTWEDEEVVFSDNGNVSSTLDVAIANDEIYAFWLDKRKKGLVLFSRKSGEKQWQSNGKIAPGTENALAVSWLKAVADSDYLYISFTYEKRPVKDYVLQIQYDRKKREWLLGTHRLDRHSADLKYIAKSVYSDMVMLPNKSILAVWEDYQDIIPGINLDIFNTKKQSWLSTKIRLTTPGKVNARLPQILLGDDKVWVVFYETPVTEGKPQPSGLVSLSYLIDPVSSLEVGGEELNTPDPKISKQQVKDKVSKIWKARIKKNKVEEWPLYDPVYRSKFNRKKWIKADSGLSYDSFKVDSIEINGLFARVKGTTYYKLPPEMLKKDSLDPEDSKGTKVDINKSVLSSYSMKFGWFHDDWYFIPEMMFMNHIDE